MLIEILLKRDAEKIKKKKREKGVAKVLEISSFEIYCGPERGRLV